MQENRTFPLRVLVLVVVSALAIALGSATVTKTYASYPGTFGSGYDTGKQQAIADWNNGYRTCTPGYIGQQICDPCKCPIIDGMYTCQDLIPRSCYGDGEP
jgi:hypothetical protein